MKRHNLTEASIIPCYLSWSVICFLLVICFFSCACRNKSAAVKQVPVDNATAAQSQNLGSPQVFVDPVIVQNKYNEIIKQVKARPAYSLFGEFLERQQYSNVLMRLDILEFFILAPSDAELKKLDNTTFTQLIYPETPNQSNVDFMLSHVAFALADPAAKKVYRTLANKSISLEEDAKHISIDNRQFPVIDEAKLPSIRILFIENYLN